MPTKKQRLLNWPGQKTFFNFSFSSSKDDNNNPVDTIQILPLTKVPIMAMTLTQALTLKAQELDVLSIK